MLDDPAVVNLFYEVLEFLPRFLLILHPPPLLHLIQPIGNLIRCHSNPCIFQCTVKYFRVSFQILTPSIPLSHIIGCYAFADHCVGDAGGRAQQENDWFEEEQISRCLLKIQELDNTNIRKLVGTYPWNDRDDVRVTQSVEQLPYLDFSVFWILSFFIRSDPIVRLKDLLQSRKVFSELHMFSNRRFELTAVASSKIRLNPKSNNLLEPNMFVLQKVFKVDGHVGRVRLLRILHERRVFIQAKQIVCHG